MEYQWNIGQYPSVYGYGSIPIHTIFSGMNIHLPAILMWTTGVQGFDTLPYNQMWLAANPPADDFPSESSKGPKNGGGF